MVDEETRWLMIKRVKKHIINCKKDGNKKGNVGW